MSNNTTWLSIEQLSEYLKSKPSTVKKWCASHKIISITGEDGVLYDRRSVDIVIKQIRDRFSDNWVSTKELSSNFGVKMVVVDMVLKNRGLEMKEKNGKYYWYRHALPDHDGTKLLIEQYLEKNPEMKKRRRVVAKKILEEYTPEIEKRQEDKVVVLEKKKEKYPLMIIETEIANESSDEEITEKQETLLEMPDKLPIEGEKIEIGEAEGLLSQYLRRDFNVLKIAKKEEWEITIIQKGTTKTTFVNTVDVQQLYKENLIHPFDKEDGEIRNIYVMDWGISGLKLENLKVFISNRKEGGMFLGKYQIQQDFMKYKGVDRVIHFDSLIDVPLQKDTQSRYYTTIDEAQKAYVDWANRVFECQARKLEANILKDPDKRKSISILMTNSTHPINK